MSLGFESFYSAGTVLAGRYEIVETLGYGGAGIVLRALDYELNKQSVALKLLGTPALVSGNAHARFKNEVLLARLLHSPNIVRIFDVGIDEHGRSFITMEYVQGCTLRTTLNEYPNGLPFERLLFLYKEILRGASHAHERGIVHRDLKPDNILVGVDGSVKIVDFGIARTVADDHSLTQTGEILGTPYYMAPEQIKVEEVDARADVYALGIVGFEMATGQRPFKHESYLELVNSHLFQRLPDFAGTLDDVPRWFEDLIQRSSAKDKKQRYASASEMLAFVDQHVLAQTPYFYWTIRQKRKIKRTALTFLVVAVLCIGIFLAAVSSRKFHSWTFALAVLELEKHFGVEAVMLKKVLNVRYDYSSKSLLKAYDSLDRETARMMLWIGVNPDIYDENGESMLFHAFNSGEAALRNLLAYSTKDINSRDKDGKTILIRVAEDSRFSMALIHDLLEAGADVNATDRNGASPLTAVTGRGDEAALILKTLFDAGADLNHLDKGRRSALLLAVISGQYELTKCILQQRPELEVLDVNGYSAVGSALGARNRKLLQLLLNNGASVATIQAYKYNPLQLAILGRWEDGARTLLEFGANPNTVNDKGETLLYQAMENRDDNLVKLLLEFHANPNEGAGPNVSPLVMAIKTKNLKLMTLLIDSGANLNTSYENGSSALHIAVTSGSGAAVELLLARGAQVDAKDRNGHTALMTAVLLRDEAISELLLKNQANPEEPALHGETPLQTARKLGLEKLLSQMKNRTKR